MVQSERQKSLSRPQSSHKVSLCQVLEPLKDKYNVVDKLNSGIYRVIDGLIAFGLCGRPNLLSSCLDYNGIKRGHLLST